MSKINITSENQRKIRKSAKIKLEYLENIQSNSDIIKLLDEFKNKFNICETIYKVLLRKYLNECKKENETKNLIINMKQVPIVFTYAGYTFEKDLLNEIFGSSSKKGKTIKKLRDAVTHGISKSATEEIMNRKEELFDYIDKFINTIKNFD